MRTILVGATLVLLAATTAACGSTADESADGDTPTIVVTTSILGDVVRNVVGPDAEVEVVMPAGTDPHEFEASAAQVAQMSEADMIIANGLGFEVNLLDPIAAARDGGVPVYEVGPDVDPLPFPRDVEDEHEGEEEDEDEAHEDEALDPHFFTDPVRVADGAENLAAALADEVPSLDPAALRERAAAYADQVRSASDEIAEQFQAVPDDQRTLVTNHEVFGYFADRYEFDVVGTVVPGGTTLAEPSSRDLAELAETIDEAGVDAIFVDTSSATQLADALASESGVDVEVVALFSESLGDDDSGAATYLEMIQTNADRITEALA